jgi:hypothetical protein
VQQAQRSVTILCILSNRRIRGFRLPEYYGFNIKRPQKKLSIVCLLSNTPSSQNLKLSSVMHCKSCHVSLCYQKKTPHKNNVMHSLFLCFHPIVRPSFYLSNQLIINPSTPSSLAESPDGVMGGVISPYTQKPLLI